VIQQYCSRADRGFRQESPVKLAVLLLILLAGCAEPLTVTSQQMAVASNWDVCTYTTMGGTLAPMAQGEVNRRGIDCGPIYNAQAAKRQADAAALQNAANYFNRAPAPVAPMMNCSSYRIGNTIQTDCR
jgi:hypothetical protein